MFYRGNKLGMFFRLNFSKITSGNSDAKARAAELIAIWDENHSVKNLYVNKKKLDACLVDYPRFQTTTTAYRNGMFDVRTSYILIVLCSIA